MSDIQITLESSNTSNCRVAPVEASENTQNLTESINALDNKIKELIALGHPSSNITMSTGAGTISTNSMFMPKLWLYLLQQETSLQFNTIRVEVRNHNYTADDTAIYQQGLSCPNPLSYFNNGTTVPRDTLRISILQIKRGTEMINTFKEKAELSGLRLIPELKVHTTMHSRHKVDVYEAPDNKGIVVITNSNEVSMLAKILGSVWSYLEIFDIGTTLKAKDITESKFLQFCKTLYNEDLQEYHNIIDTIKAEYEEHFNSTEYLSEQLKKCQEAATKHKTQNMTRRERDLKSNIESYEEQIVHYYANLREVQLQILAAQLSESEADKNMEDLIVFLNKAKNTVKLYKAHETDGTLILDITTPMNSYRRKDIEMYYKNPERSNLINKHIKVALAFQKTFIDEEYDLITKTRVALKIANNTGDSIAQGIDDYSVDLNGTSSNEALRYGNAHIAGFNCFSSSKKEIEKALSTGNYVMAVAQLISACASVTFTDSIVITSMVDRLNKHEADKPIFKRRLDGEMVSLNQIYIHHMESTKPSEPKPTTAPTMSVDDAIFLI